MQQIYKVGLVLFILNMAFYLFLYASLSWEKGHLLTYQELVQLYHKQPPKQGGNSPGIPPWPNE